MATKKYGIYFKVTFTSIDEEEDEGTIVEEGYVEREYEPGIDPETEFEEEFMNNCEDEYVDVPDWDNGYNTNLEITKVKKLK